MFLFSGRLVSSKNIMMLLRLFEEIGYPDIGLFVLGDGELQDEVSRLSQKVKTPRIYYEGFKQKEDCISYFSLADIFILPTLLDRASIVMSEALISGLFTIASTYDGSSYYLIQEGNNGLVVNPNDREALKNAILTAYQMKKTGQLAKKSIQDTMEGYTIDKYAQRFIDMIKKRNERQERRLP
jgi:glycosyltransferase involved in cell wall biosynthesis